MAQPTTLAPSHEAWNRWYKVGVLTGLGMCTLSIQAVFGALILNASKHYAVSLLTAAVAGGVSSLGNTILTTYKVHAFIAIPFALIAGAQIATLLGCAITWKALIVCVLAGNIPMQLLILSTDFMGRIYRFAEA